MSKYGEVKKKVFAFFENPKSNGARFVHIFVIGVIILSAGVMIVEYAYTDVFDKYRLYFDYLDWGILAIFTVEYLLRIWSAPNRIKFFFNFFNLIDFFAVAPMYLQLANTSALRSLRLIRILRFTRIFRVFRIFKFQKLFGTIFKIKNTVLERILPVMTIFVVLKICILFLEVHGYWIDVYNLETVFAVVGFALGIILSQKIGVAYDKFIMLEDAVTRIHGTLISLNSIFKKVHKSNKPSETLVGWTDTFHEILLRKKPKSDFYEINENLYDEIHRLFEVDNDYTELVSVYTELNKDASFILNRMDALTPPAYDQILHRSTLFYSLLMVVFLPGVVGIVATVIATYVLYGMYYVTADMDNAMRHLEDQLINADINDLISAREKLR